MISTGIRGLDSAITGLRSGDNVVWQIDDINDYISLVRPFVEKAVREKKKVIYIRFASHKELVRPLKAVKRYELDAQAGFENFTAKVTNIISQEGQGAYYVFDCLSELLLAWATDLMIGDFFMVTCPYLFELKTITYFSIMRNHHSFKSIARIRETTQLLLDVYRCSGSCYIHPLKVWNRYSPTMFLPHQVRGENCVPITDSVNSARLLNYIREKKAQSAKRNLDYWDRLFIQAEEMAGRKLSKADESKFIRKLCGIMISKNKKILALAAKNFSLKELIEIKSRLIGTGFIGGKTVGMLLARKMLYKGVPDWQNYSEAHDSFYIGSDIFYSYIVHNRWWKLYVQHKTEEGYFNVAQALKEKMLYGVFPEEIMEYFQQVVEYFGSSPIIIRSSSLLEDSFGNAFAGKYESVFLANQGTPEQRYIQFTEAIRKVYASTMSQDALVYRKQRGLDRLDEQMALLVQRVSGAYHGDYFFPDLGGVGISYNTYVWNKDIDPKEGMLRVVFGLGTRAVNRVEGDYPRILALSDPLRRPYSEKDDLRKYSQHKVDLINIKENILETVPFNNIMNASIYPDVERIAQKDFEGEEIMGIRGQADKSYWLLTLDNVFKEYKLVDFIKGILQVLEEGYAYPVEIEFTVNFDKQGSFKINLLQCRPLQSRGLGKKVIIPAKIDKERILFDSREYFLGGNIAQRVRWVIYIDPHRYAGLGLSDKYEIARIVGKLNIMIKSREEIPALLMGPGRWGTTTPSLGVPVKFAEISNIAVLSEVAFSSGNLMPELSFGTHFFQDLIEANIFYLALFPGRKNVYFEDKFFKRFNNLFARLIPESARYEDVVGVYDFEGMNLKVMSDILSQKVVCFF